MARIQPSQRVTNGFDPTPRLQFESRRGLTRAGSRGMSRNADCFHRPQKWPAAGRFVYLCSKRITPIPEVILHIPRRVRLGLTIQTNGNAGKREGFKPKVGIVESGRSEARPQTRPIGCLAPPVARRELWVSATPLRHPMPSRNSSIHIHIH